MASRYTSKSIASLGRKVLRIGCVLVVLISCIGCSNESRFSKKRRATVSNARLIHWAWKVTRMEMLYPDLSVLDGKQRVLIERIKSHGLDWQQDGAEVTYREVLEGAAEERVKSLKLSPRDGWGQPYEFRIVDEVLVIRSSGADRIFDTDKYYYGTSPALSGGDFVVIGGAFIRSAKAPRMPDWFKDNSLKGGKP